jgi:DNA-binding FadR family transcriptional regulator
VAFREVIRKPVYLQVAEQLREAILEGDLPAGEPLPTERELSVQFGVSRPTVREALRVLQAEGLVAGGGPTSPMRPGVPAEVSSESMRAALTHLVRLRRVPLADLVELRCALEASALARAARAPLPEPLAEARRVLGEMRRDGLDVAAFHEADVRFHVALVAASGNQATHAIMAALRESIAEHLVAALEACPDPREVIRRLAAEHEAILAAVEAGDGEEAAARVRAHITGFYEGTQTTTGEAG